MTSLILSEVGRMWADGGARNGRPRADPAITRIPAPPGGGYNELRRASRLAGHLNSEDGSMAVPGKYWHELDDGRIQCDLCPRHCRLHEGQHGLCFVWARQADQVVLTTYGRSSGFCVDPIEKKPLNHFLPGTPVLSFGTAGCNLACRFCQNWDISKSREIDTLTSSASPDAMADADACRERGIKAVAVSAGYMEPAARAEFYQHMDAANIDLKAFTEEFYKKITFAKLGVVLETLEYLHHETDVWFEVTTLLIPDRNDSDEELDRLTTWVAEHLGPDVPLHFTAFHPDFKMMDVPPTPPAT